MTKVERFRCFSLEMSSGENLHHMLDYIGLKNPNPPRNGLSKHTRHKRRKVSQTKLIRKHGALPHTYLELLGLVNHSSGRHTDLTVHTLSFLTGRETCNMMCTCTRFRKVAKTTLRAGRHCALIRNNDIEEELTVCPRVKCLCYESLKVCILVLI